MVSSYAPKTLGCAGLKLEDQEVVALCRKHTLLLVDAIYHCYALADAHVAYSHSFRSVSAALHTFLHGNHAVPPGSSFSSPPCSPPSMPSIASSLTTTSSSSAMPPLYSSIVSLPGGTASPPPLSTAPMLSPMFPPLRLLREHLVLGLFSLRYLSKLGSAGAPTPIAICPAFVASSPLSRRPSSWRTLLPAALHCHRTPSSPPSVLP